MKLLSIEGLRCESHAMNHACYAPSQASIHRPLNDVMFMNVATVQERLLYFLRRSGCGYYSRAATILGVATIQINTVLV